MASITVIKRRYERDQARLDLYLRAEEAILGGAQSYTIGSRNLTRADLGEITEMIATLEDRIAEDEAALGSATGGRRKAVGVVLRDF